MSIDATIPADVMARMQEAAERAAKGIRDPADLRIARQEMNRLREELRQRIGTVDIVVDLIRDARNQ